MSEYRSSYCASSTNHLLDEGARGGGGGGGAASPLGSDLSGGDDDDLGMGAYRASAYVPKVVPQGMPSRGRSYARASTKLGRQDRPSAWLPSSSAQARRIEAEAEAEVEELRRSTGAPRVPRERRTSLQQTSSGPEPSMYSRGGQRQADDESAPACSRRRSESYTTGARLSADSGGGQPSRLSELEQRIQENKRRREELLAGNPSASSSPKAQRRELAGVGGKPAVGAEEAAVGGATRDVSPSPARFSRPSRLESMEARIKRKSYSVRLADCSPERSLFRHQQVGGEKSSGRLLAGGSSANQQQQQQPLAGSGRGQNGASSKQLPVEQ